MIGFCQGLLFITGAGKSSIDAWCGIAAP